MNPFAADRDVGRSDVVPKLILPRETVEEPVQIDITAVECRAVVGLFERPNQQISGGRHASVLATPL